VRGLELSQEKSKITHINDGFDFLGFNVRKYKNKCLIKPKKDAVKSIYSSIRESVTSNKTVTQKRLIRLIIPKIKGWASFFCHAASKRTFSLLDDKLFKLLWRWACRRHPNKSRHWIRKTYFHSKGNQHWVFMTTDNEKQIVLPRFDATKIIRHNKIRNNANPYDRNWDDYFELRARKRFAKHEIISKLAKAN
jgi:RNA-directed DNA polymerase